MDDSFLDLEDLFDGSHATSSAASSPAHSAFLNPDPIQEISTLIPPDLGREVTTMLGLEDSSFPSLPSAAPATSSAPPARKRKTAEKQEKQATRSAPALATISESLSPEEQSRLSKRQKRLVKNRESAMLSRQRKKAYMDDMERKVEYLSRENAELKNKVAALQEENRVLRDQNSSRSSQQSTPPPTAPTSPKAGVATAKATALLAVVLCCGLFFQSALDPSLPGAVPLSSSDTSGVIPFATSSHNQLRDYAHSRPNGRVLLSDGGAEKPRSVEEKRQTLLLVLLQHVCNKLKTSPRTFFVLCQKLYEMGIIENLSLLEDPLALERAYTQDFSNLFVNINSPDSPNHSTQHHAGGAATATASVSVTDVLKLTPSHQVPVSELVFSPVAVASLPQPNDDADDTSSSSAIVLCPRGSRVMAPAQEDDTDEESTNKENRALSIVVPASAFAGQGPSPSSHQEDNSMVELRCAPGSFSLHNLSGVDEHLLSVM